MNASPTIIDFSQPFASVLAAVRSLPSGDRCSDSPIHESSLKDLLRGLYEAANGRHVETVVGLIPIAPPVAPFLREAPFQAANQNDFLTDAATRVLGETNHPAAGRSGNADPTKHD